MSGLWVTVWTVVIIFLSAFFGAAEFALMSAKRHRLEQAAKESAAGRAALKNSAELTLLLAGSQLGITVCTLALGAITKPAVHHAPMPLLEVTGMPVAVADVVAFVLALFIVTFLHLVVGEMAPKSWAIAHPEQSSVLLAVPMRMFMFLARPILKAMNSMANWLVRKAGATPVEQLSYEARYNASTGLNCNDERLIKAVAYQCAALVCSVYERHDTANVFLSLAAALCNNDKM